MLKKIVIQNIITVKLKKYCTFVSTVLTTLPIRTASQGESFAFINFSITILLPPSCLIKPRLGGFLFKAI
jgi:hypothetical protein